MEKTLSRQYINFHDAVITSIGPYGRAQGYMLVATILLNMFSSWSMVYINFQSDKWHILVQNHGKNMSNVDQLNGWNKSVNTNGSLEFTTTNCSYYDFSLNRTMNENKLVFGKGENTMVGELQMVCPAREGIPNFIQSLQMAGSMIGAMFIGQCGDLYGRKDGMVFTYVILVLFAFIEGFSLNYYVVVLCRIMIGFSASALLVISQIWLLEFASVKLRTTLAAVPGWQIGYIVLGIMGTIFPNWRNLLVALSLLGSPMFIIFPFSLESTRWLIVQNRLADAKEDLTKACERNGRVFDSKEFDSVVTYDMVEVKKYQLRYSTITVLSHKLTRGKTLPLILMWFTASFGYFAHSTNTTRLEDDAANIVVQAFLEIFLVFLLYLLTVRVGRQYTVATAFSLVAMASTAITVVHAVDPKNFDAQSFHDIFAWLSRAILSSLSFCLILLTAEIFPTVVRTSACGLFYVSYHCGALVGLESQSSAGLCVPYGVTSVLAVMSALCCLLFEDTYLTKLEDYYHEE